MALSRGCRAILIACMAVLKECVSRLFVEHSQRDCGALLSGCRALLKEFMSRK